MKAIDNDEITIKEKTKQRHLQTLCDLNRLNGKNHGETLSEINVNPSELKAKCPEINDETYTNDSETKKIIRENLTEYEWGERKNATTKQRNER